MKRILAAVASLIWFAAVASSVPAWADASASGELAKKATWQPTNVDAARQQAFAWLDGQHPSAEQRAAAEKIWPAADRLAGEPLLARTVEFLAALDPRARELTQLCSQPRKELSPPKLPWLTDAQLPPFFRNNLRLWYGRWLAQERLYDEAQTQLAGLEPADVVDPASLLFYQSAAYHYLLNKEAGLKSIDRLLEREAELPKRYATMARLMQGDLAALKDESLDHISRRMDDIKRRLDLGRTGGKVRTEEDGVIASLDKMIDQIEKQQQQQQQQLQKNNSPRMIRPAQESRPSDLKGSGDVTKRDIGHQSGWGDLPPKQREEAMQQIGKEFPSHYRDIIEQYFRKIADEESPK